MKLVINMIKYFIKYRVFLLLTIFALGLTVSSCNRYGCKGIDQNTGEFKVKKKAKTTSGLFSKGDLFELRADFSFHYK